jgi:hypothetical protein
MERSGRVVAVSGLLSPLFERPCVAYDAIVDEPGLWWRVKVARAWEPSADGPAGGYREPPHRLVLRKCTVLIG